MHSVDSLTMGIRTHGPGSRVAAFFDFDGTLVEKNAQGAADHGGPFDEAEFTRLLERGLQRWLGQTEDELSEIGNQLFVSETAGALFHGAWRLVRAHQNRGHTVVVVTSGTRQEAEPLARELGIEHVLSTALETENGVLTGRVTGRPLWGEGKLAAVRDFGASNDIDLQNSYAYADGAEDIPLLDAVGFPHAVNAESALGECAQSHGWPSIELRTRRRKFDPIPVVRTAAMFGSLIAAAGVGALAGVAVRDRRRGVDVATTLFGHVAGRLGNIKFDVTGAENTYPDRAAVYFVNHQSTLIDVLVTSRVLQRGFTIVAKAEVKQMPVVGTIFDLADVAFVDRSDTAKAISALEPALDKLRSGVSIAMAPEGTRSISPNVGPLKKGGFHLAKDAGVPIVPIVIRNAGEIMWRNAMIAQSGTIEVAVHEPLPTTGWSREDINTWLPRVQQLYVDTLDDWPGVEAGRQWSKDIANATPSGG